MNRINKEANKQYCDNSYFRKTTSKWVIKKLLNDFNDNMNIGGSKYEDEKSGKTDEYSKKKKTFKSEN